MTTISKHFTLEELTDSATARQLGYKNVPGAQEICNLCALVHNILEPLRKEMGLPLKISSGYRSAQLNKAVGGVSNSQHMKGEAADIDIEGDLGYGKRIFAWIKNHCQYDQLIWEHNHKGTYWVHVSYRSDGQNRRQCIDNLLKR